MMVRLAAALAAGVLVLAACNGDGGDGSSAEAFCGPGVAVNEAIDALGEAESSADLADQIDRIDGLLDDAADSAPDEIRDDVETLARILQDSFAAMSEALEEVTEDPQAAAQNPEILRAIQEAAPSPEEAEELDEASQNIDRFVDVECNGSGDGDSNGGSTEE